MKHTLSLAVLFLTSCATGKVALDTSTVSPIEANDATALVQGCGAAPAVGIAYCRVEEGSATSDKIYFVAPPSTCSKDTCAFVKVWNSQGALVFGAPIPKGETKIGVSWATLLSQGTAQATNALPTIPGTPTALADSFDISQRGFWSWNVQVYFKGSDGRERMTQAQGDILLRIYKKGYVPLQEVSNDPNFVWTWNDQFNGKTYQFNVTSALRAYVGETK